MSSKKYYCGPYWIPSKVRRIVSSKFNASCKIHDMDYESMKYGQKQADKRFRAHALRQAGNHIGWRIVARLFYIMVRVGGKLSYGKKDS